MQDNRNNIQKHQNRVKIVEDDKDCNAHMVIHVLFFLESVFKQLCSVSKVVVVGMSIVVMVCLNKPSWKPM